METFTKQNDLIEYLFREKVIEKLIYLSCPYVHTRSCQVVGTLDLEYPSSQEGWTKLTSNKDTVDELISYITLKLLELPEDKLFEKIFKDNNFTNLRNYIIRIIINSTSPNGEFFKNYMR